MQTKNALPTFLAVSAISLAMLMVLETVNYTYDAKGRLVRVTRSDGNGNTVVTNYQFDPADNRKNVTVSGAH